MRMFFMRVSIYIFGSGIPEASERGAQSETQSGPLEGWGRGGCVAARPGGRLTI